MKVSYLLKKLELKQDSSADALALLKFLKTLDPNRTLQWSSDATQDGVHAPIDVEGNIHLDKKRFFRECETFPEDDYYWVPLP
jgi:hypothetical protein